MTVIIWLLAGIGTIALAVSMVLCVVGALPLPDKREGRYTVEEKS